MPGQVWQNVRACNCTRASRQIAHPIHNQHPTQKQPPRDRPTTPPPPPPSTPGIYTRDPTQWSHRSPGVIPSGGVLRTLFAHASRLSAPGAQAAGHARAPGGAGVERRKPLAEDLRLSGQDLVGTGGTKQEETRAPRERVGAGRVRFVLVLATCSASSARELVAATGGRGVKSGTLARSSFRIVRSIVSRSTVRGNDPAEHLSPTPLPACPVP